MVNQMDEIFELNFEECEYNYISYHEYDTGYTEYGCGLFDEMFDDKKHGCRGDLDGGCPLCFKYHVEM